MCVQEKILGPRIVEWDKRITTKGILILFLPLKQGGKTMSKRFHGIDRHKRFSTICVLEQSGEELEFIAMCTDLKRYIRSLGSEDAVVLEASTGTFWWADQIEAQGALCFILDPHKFRIIKDSWNKTDKHDARNMAKALWVYQVTGEFGIPTVHKPQAVIRELRTLFSQYMMLNRQIRMLKNSIHATFGENGIALSSAKAEQLLSAKTGTRLLEELNISVASKTCIEMNQSLLWAVLVKKQQMVTEILLAGEQLRKQVELLITIKGITPLTALAFLADVGDVRRFRTTRKMNAYLGLVPRSKDSGGNMQSGHINRESRKLTRTLLTQSIHHVSRSSPYLRNYYCTLTERRGCGRARIALIRKTCAMMRRMLLNDEPFRWVDRTLFEKKLKQYRYLIEKNNEERKSA